MSNRHRNTHRLIRRLATGLAIAATATTAAVAGTFVGPNLAAAADVAMSSPNKFDPTPIDDAPTLQPVVDVKFDPFVPAPIPCLGWWCDASPFLLPDYAVSWDPIPNPTVMYQGQLARVEYVRVLNEGTARGGDVWHSLAANGADILGLEAANASRTDLEFAPVSDTARWSAPLATPHLDGAWLIHDTDGIGFTYADWNYVRVYLEWTPTRADVTLMANTHVGVDVLGAPAPAGYPQSEVTRDNNRLDF